jgi:hypothetical protein
VIAILVALSLFQTSECRGEGAARLAAAAAQGEAFDLAGAAPMFGEAAALGCPAGHVAAEYVRGLLAARAAYREGGSPESLEPVKRAVAALDLAGGTQPGPAQIARFVLLAAAAASQSERDEMALMIDQALRVEQLQLSAGQPAAPVVTAHEAAGDFWLQVHRFDEARAAYELAERRVGRTARVMVGLARVAARLSDDRSACRHYADLIAWWGARSPERAEVTEARSFLTQAACSAQR